ncbi:MAG: ribosome biogenesis GTP-binding protein YihA/YsxC [Holosporaceae bacterium]|nr:ribosome biogenesis GTP-binding protein YihA/YsxC [Holosporaceae bacterium]
MKNSADVFSKCVFVAGAAELWQIPGAKGPEVAFVGRSNVGKSSLINAVTSSRRIARVSRSPGRTQQINFFTMADEISLVDLPGYGYAEVSKGTRKSWDNLIRSYLAGRQNLMRVFLLIDSRHGVKKNDEEIMELLDRSAVAYQIVLTKTDKVKDRTYVREEIATKILAHTAAHPEIIETSAEKMLGIESLREEVRKFIQGYDFR